MMTFAEVGRLADPVSLLLVFGGAFLSAAVRATRGDVAAALRALRPCLCADPASDEAAARVGVARIERAAAERARGSVDRLDQGNRFVGQAARALAEAADAAQFRAWAEGEAAALARRHRRAQGVWQGVADAAPAMGMIGTVMGLMGMFAALDDMGAIGPAMALAMRTTLHGLLLSAGIAGPVAARLERLSSAEAEWRGLVCARLARIAEEEAAPASRPRARLRLVE